MSSSDPQLRDQSINPPGPDQTQPADLQPDDAPPFLGTWPRVYQAVILYLVGLIFVLYLLTRAFAPPKGL